VRSWGRRSPAAGNVIGSDEKAPVGMCFMPVTDPKTVKNRVHLDLTASAQDRDQEIEHLLALGARRVDIGQTGAESWIVPRHFTVDKDAQRTRTGRTRS
jgi:hypothetical protein